jgi:hypothetical protein
MSPVVAPSSGIHRACVAGRGTRLHRERHPYAGGAPARGSRDPLSAGGDPGCGLTESRDSGGVLWAPSGPIGLARDALREGSRVDEVEREIPASGNSRAPWPTTTGQMSRLSSSRSSFSSSHRIRVPLPCSCSSPPGLALSSRMDAARSPERTVVRAHCGSVRVFDATYLRFVFKAPTMGSSRSSLTPQYRRRARRCAGRTGTRRRAGRPGWTNVMASSSDCGLAHPPRSIPGSSFSSRPPFACITPSTETCVEVVSFIGRRPLLLVGRRWSGPDPAPSPSVIAPAAPGNSGRPRACAPFRRPVSAATIPALLGVEAELELAGPERRARGACSTCGASPRSRSAPCHAARRRRRRLASRVVTVLPPPAALRPALGRARWTACGGRRCLAHRLHPARRRRVRDGEHVAGRERDPGPEHDEHQRHAEAHAARQHPLGRDQHGH